MADTLYNIGVLLTMYVTLPGLLICLLVIIIGATRGAKKNQKQKPKRIVPEGECAHRSTKDLKVTQMGDAEDYYLCTKCGKKVPATELFEFN